VISQLYFARWVGSYDQISVKKLDRYLDELEFRFNNRNNPYLFRDALLRLIASSNLEHNDLIRANRARRIKAFN
jgi:hypothetical protein